VKWRVICLAPEAKASPLDGQLSRMAYYPKERIERIKPDSVQDVLPAFWSSFGLESRSCGSIPKAHMSVCGMPVTTLLR
jgi:hypothetical protein